MKTALIITGCVIYALLALFGLSLCKAAARGNDQDEWWGK